MKVRTATIIGLVIGLLFGSYFESQLENLAIIIAVITTGNVLFFRKQILKGPFFGLICGVMLGYTLTYFLDFI